MLATERGNSTGKGSETKLSMLKRQKSQCVCCVGSKERGWTGLGEKGRHVGAWTREIAVEIEPRGYIRAMKSYVKLTDGR